MIRHPRQPDTLLEKDFHFFVSGEHIKTVWLCMITVSIWKTQPKTVTASVFASCGPLTHLFFFTVSIVSTVWGQSKNSKADIRQLAQLKNSFGARRIWRWYSQYNRYNFLCADCYHNFLAEWVAVPTQIEQVDQLFKDRLSKNWKTKCQMPNAKCQVSAKK